jgi:serine phosphatase RsbU (regulator of sigma subunit)
MTSRLLVVDDNEMNRDLLSRRLQRLGHETVAASDGREALMLMRSQPFDLVLLDITMPGMDGYEVLLQLRNDEALRHIPVIMVSAIDEVESVVRCLELGAEDYLGKPFNPLVLKARVDASLARKLLRDREQAHAQMLVRELEIGRQIQAGFLPERLPEPAGWHLDRRFVPARQVGGDFYDAFQLPDGRLCLLVADVCDKGVGAALYMALFRSLIRATAMQSAAETADGLLRRTLSFTNDYIANVHGRASMFATVFVAVLDPANGMLVYANAGHDPPMLWRQSGGAPDRLMPTATALGLLPNFRMEVCRTGMLPGDMLLAYTDGVTDAGGQGGAFGEERLLDVIALCAGRWETLLDRVTEALESHMLGVERHDDITLLAVSRLNDIPPCRA